MKCLMDLQLILLFFLVSHHHIESFATTHLNRRISSPENNTVTFATKLRHHLNLDSKQRNARSDLLDAQDTQISTLTTAKLQFSRLFGENVGSMSRNERLTRIFTSWILLLCAKAIALRSPLYFKRLVERGALLVPSTKFEQGVESMLLGVVSGLGASRIASGIVQLFSELILSPATTSAAEALPMEAFTAALSSASRRQDDRSGGSGTAALSSDPQAANKKVISGTEAAAGGQDEGMSGFARRTLDRGLKASNQFLYRSIFNLLPSFVESLCVLYMMCSQAGVMVGVTAGIVAAIFVSTTSLIMMARVPILRERLKCEGVANGCAEDALSLAETVAAFGADPIERKRYGKALADVGLSELRVRQSFSVLKMVQAIIIGFGAAAVTYASWKSAQIKMLPSYTGQLVLVSSLFAQLCAPLDHVGQHFRDCVTAAEDLRELENLKAAASSVASVPNPPSQNRNMQMLKGDRGEAHTDIDKESDTDSEARPGELPQMYRQAGGRSQWASYPPRLEIKNLTFQYSSSVTAATVKSASSSAASEDTAAAAAAGGRSQAKVQKSLLNNINLVIPGGGYSVGLVGPSGSGKSTLLRVLVGLEQLGKGTVKLGNEHVAAESSGSILMDGVDVSKLQRSSLFAMVGQENDLFRSLNLKENVRYGTHSILKVADEDSDEGLAAFATAVADARLSGVAKRLKGGWEAAVGPRGRFLSGGERQRVCVARALYREELGEGVLLMDEVTSSLDAQTESQVIKAIMRRIAQGSVAILVAHRLSSVQQCDLILVLRDGNIVEQGTHEELVQAKGWYAESWALQSKSQRETG